MTMKPPFSSSKTTSWLVPALFVGLCFGPTGPVQANETGNDLALGRAGEVFRLRQDLASSLFGAAAAEPKAPALALEMTLSDGSKSQLAIPGTDDGRLEKDGGLLYDETSNSLILYWQSQGADGILFRFASFDGELSPVGTLMNGTSPVLFGAAPQLAISRDAFSIQLMNSQVIVAHRTTLHLAWREGENARARYSPLTFVEGQWVGWNEILDLSGLVRSRRGPAEAPATGPLASYLALRVDDTRRAAAITMADGPSGLLSEIEVRFLPMNLEQVGERVRTRFFRIATVFKPTADMDSVNGQVGFQIVHIGQRSLGSEALTALADGLRRGVIELQGASCSAGAAPQDVYVGLAGIGKDGALGLPASLAGEFMHVAVIGREPDQLESLIGGVGFQIVHIGSIAAGCNQPGGAQDMIQVAETGEILHIDMTGARLSLDPMNSEIFASNNGWRDALTATSAFWMRNEVSAPNLGDAAVEALLLSPATGDFLIAWVDGNVLRFAQTERHLWSQNGAVALNEEMTAELAIELLHKKLR